MREKNSKEAILACALALFAEKGYEAVSPNEIVEQVGVTKPTLYYFFGSKEGLFDELLQTNYARLDRLLEERCRYSPVPGDYSRDVYPVLLGLAEALFAFARDNTAFYLMSLSLSFAPPSSRKAAVSEQYHRRQYDILEELFREIARVHPNLRGKERICSWRFLAVVNAQIGFWHRGYGELDGETARSIVTVFMHGIFS